MFPVKKKNIMFPLCAFALMLSSCCSAGYFTPGRACTGLYSAFLNHDIELMRRILSVKSIARMTVLRENLASFDDKQAESASKLYGLSAKELKSLSEEKLLNIIFSQKDVIFHGGFSIAGVVESGNNAVVRLRNGNELDFVKEGPYWKFDLSSL